ncbi:uncharacterized protein LOC144153528 [Haemaphysalis longicornis]
MTSPSQPPIVCSGAIRERDPPMFYGDDDQDVEDWLASYERVSAHNRWDDRMKLNNVPFYLKRLAEMWYLNHGADLQSWSAFKTDFMKVFGRPAVRKLLAEQLLRERAQNKGETFTSYIEDVIGLCKRADPSMSEADKIKHLLKGIDDDAFQMLLSKDPQTVGDVINWCQSFDELRKQRLLTRRSASQPGEPLSGLVVGSEESSLMPRIQDFIRQEIARQLSLLSCAPATVSAPPLSSTPQQAIREQFADALPSACPSGPVAAPISSPLTYTAALLRSRQQAPLCAPRSPQIPSVSPPRPAPHAPNANRKPGGTIFCPWYQQSHTSDRPWTTCSQCFLQRL